MPNARALLRRSHTWGLIARRRPHPRLTRAAALTAALAVLIVTPAEGRYKQRPQRHHWMQAQAVVPQRARALAPRQKHAQAVGLELALVAALKLAQAVTLKLAQAVTVQLAQAAALQQAQAAAVQQKQAQEAALKLAQAQAAALQQAQAAAVQQKQAQEAALKQKQAQEAALGQAQAAAVLQKQAQKPIKPAVDPLTPVERIIFNAVNRERSVAGLPSMQPDLTLVAAARAHSAQMRDAGRLFHTANLATAAPAPWRSLGENVGTGPSAESVHAWFMVSGPHRTNVLGGFDRIGIGVAVTPGRIWVTQEFMRTG